jgi:transposase
VGDRARPTCARRRTPSSICRALAAPWRYLRRDSFPARSTVYNIFRKFQPDGVWEAIWAELHMALRERMGREASPSAAVLDSQSVKSAEKGGGTDNQMGYDAGKQVKGRKIHALVDSEGLPMRVVVHSAAIQDRDGAGLVLDKIRRRFPWLELIWADGGYNAWQVDAAVAKVPALRMEIVKRSDDMKGFVVLPRRWVVERTFSWFGRNRRLAKDFENLAKTLGAFVALASIQLALRRPARA